MTDVIDRAQEREQLDRDLALKEQRREKTKGTTHCTDCGAPIASMRQEMGATRCVAHQAALEADARKRTARCAI
jgi:RNA polymerase-binding transcription factor DksA